jgi:hypothetical protein
MNNLFKKIVECGTHIQNRAANILQITTIAALLSSSAIIAQGQVFNFDQWSFTVANYTRGGYSHLVQTTTNDPNSHLYQLTSIAAPNYMTFYYDQWVAMWYTNPNAPNQGKIDLSKDMVFNCKISFGYGEDNRINITDGVVFVMTTTPPSDTLVGGVETGIGYSDLPGYSAAVEFDVRHDGTVEGGGPNTYPTSYDPNCHTSYLKNGTMTALPGTYNMMLNNWESVRGRELCVVIVWQRNGNGGNLITYINNVRRNNKYFPTLDSLVTGLSLNNPFVSWGITASTCLTIASGAPRSGNPNTQRIEFINMLNGDSIDFSPFIKPENN